MAEPTRFATLPEGDDWKPALDGSNINRYHLAPSTEWVSLAEGAIKSGGNALVHEQDRIGVRQIGASPVATLLPGGEYSLNTIYNLYFTGETEYNLRYVLGIVASEALRWYWGRRFSDQKKVFPKVKKKALMSIPVPRIDFEDPGDVARHDGLVGLVTAMLDLHRRRAQADGHERTNLDRRISATDRQIDDAVFDLYGLADADRALVRASL